MDAFAKPGPNKRVCGYLVDMALAGIVSLVIAATLGKIPQFFFFLFYFLARDSFDGQSLGKRIVGMKVVNLENAPSTPGQGLLRNLIIILPLFPIIEYFVLLKNQDGQRLGDKLAKTKVHDLNPEIKDSKFLWMSIAIFIGYIIVSGIVGSMLGLAGPR